jgi:predicted MFS family arabinose efflux permease
LKRVGDGSSYLLHVAREPKQNTSVWFALRNPAFVGLWLPSVVSGACVSAHDTEELASAITLGGVQMNLGGILGPAFGGLLLPIMGPAMLFSLNALAFLTMAWVISQRYRRRRRPEPHLENFLESFASAVRYVRYTPGMQVILTRNFICSLFIAAVPALVPVVALQHLRFQASHLGLVFTSMGIGSLLGATLILPYARAKASPNTLTILAGVMLVVVLVLMSIVPNLWMFLPVTALAGISWTVKAWRPAPPTKSYGTWGCWQSPPLVFLVPWQQCRGLKT